MGRSQESFRKKEVRNKKEQKRKEKEKKKAARNEGEKSGSLDDMIAYVDSNGVISDTPPDPDEKKEEIKLEDIETSVPKKEERDDEDPIRKGTITYFNDQKGFGFIKDSKTHEDIFVHINEAQEDLKEGNLVSFEVMAGNRGPAATNVKVER